MDPAGGAAADAFVVECQRRAYLTALQMLGHRDDALDVAQEAVVRVLRAGSRLDAGGAWRTYLARTVTNLVRDLWRRRSVRRSQSLEELVLDRGFDVLDGRESPEQAAARHQMRRRAAAALAVLPEPYREILVLRDYQDLSYAQIADALDVPIGTVMSRLHKARLLLREAVIGGGGRTS